METFRDKTVLEDKLAGIGTSHSKLVKLLAGRKPLKSLE
jgi:hypothetical protein